MKKTSTLYIIIVFLTSHSLQSQEDIQRNCILKYDVISLLGDQVSNSMGVRLGAEIMYDDKKSLVFDAMYIFPCNSSGGAYTKVETENTVGFMVSADYRFYLFQREHAIGGFHIGPRLAYQFTRSEMS